MTWSSPFMCALLRWRSYNEERRSKAPGKWRKSAENCPLMLGGRTLRGNHFTRECEALPTTGLASERAIGRGRAGGPVARRLAHVGLSKGIADTDDHDRHIKLMRMCRNSFHKTAAIYAEFPPRPIRLGSGQRRLAAHQS